MAYPKFWLVRVYEQFNDRPTGLSDESAFDDAREARGYFWHMYKGPGTAALIQCTDITPKRRRKSKD
jgi:hypothetical protein